MIAMLGIGIAMGVCLGAVAWEVLFCDPLRRDNDELRMHSVRKDIRSLADRYGYINYRAQHAGTPYLDNRDHSKSAELRIVQ